jgi:hypothetical protein
LFSAKYQIDPVREVSRDVIGLESFSVSMNKEGWFIKGPGRKDDIVDRITANLLLAEIVVVLPSAFTSIQRGDLRH